MDAQAAVRRSTRARRPVPKVETAQPSTQPAASIPATAKSTGGRENAKKREEASTEPEETKPKRHRIISKQVPQFRYVCPIPGCTQSKSQARSLKNHYNDDHNDVANKKEWNSSLAIEMPYLDWLADESLATAAEINKFGYLLRQQSPAPSATTSIGPASPVLETAMLPPSNLAPATLPDAATTTVAADDNNNNAAPPASRPSSKQARLDRLLDEQRAQLQNFMEHELLRDADREAENALARLRGVVSTPEVQAARIRELEAKVATLEEDLEEEKQLGRSASLREMYLHQARLEARLTAKEPKHGGFVY